MADHGASQDLTVGAAAARVGVTVRTLRHWDTIDLARPSRHSATGYRLYTDGDVELLRRVIVYRELGLDLATIRGLLDDPDTDVVTALRAQRADLVERIEHLTGLRGDLDRMIEAHEHGLLLGAEEQTTILGPGWDPTWPLRARERHGDTVQWRQAAERAAHRDAAGWLAVAEATRAVERALVEAMVAGTEAGSPEADALVERHREALSAHYPVSREMQVLLGRTYEADPAFAAHYDGLHVGLAAWLRSIIDARARADGIDPGTAAWR